MKRLFSILAALVILFTSSAPVSANTWDNDWNRRVYRPAYGYDVHLPVCIHRNLGGPYWNLADPRHARINEALTMWNNVGSDFYFFRASGTCQSIANAGDQYVGIGTASTAWWGTQTGLAVNDYTITKDATYPGCDQYLLLSCRYVDSIWLNPNVYFNWSAQYQSAHIFARDVLIHEFGHSLELVHKTDYPNVMVGSYSQQPHPITGLGAEDIGALLELYGYH